MTEAGSDSGYSMAAMSHQTNNSTNVLQHTGKVNGTKSQNLGQPSNTSSQSVEIAENGNTKSLPFQRLPPLE